MLQLPSHVDIPDRMMVMNGQTWPHWRLLSHLAWDSLEQNEFLIRSIRSVTICGYLKSRWRGEYSVWSQSRYKHLGHPCNLLKQNIWRFCYHHLRVHLNLYSVHLVKGRRPSCRSIMVWRLLPVFRHGRLVQGKHCHKGWCLDCL